MAKTITAPTVRRDIYAEVTNKILHDLEHGIAPWAKPWSNAAAPLSMPVNATTNRAYSGVNVLLLWNAMAEGGYDQNRWATFKQIQAAGGNVRKGSKGTMVVYADRFIPGAEKERAARDGDAAKAIPFLKSFCVFNLAQCEGVDHLAGETVAPIASDAFADIIASLSPVTIKSGGDRAFYSPSADYVQMPHLHAFADPLDYSRTLAHELVHSTGHASRLDRTFGKRFADAHYAREELCAELGAAFACAAHGVAATTRHADYLGHWIAVLKEDNRAIFRAASAASKAADYLLANAPAPVDPDPKGEGDKSEYAPTLFPVEPVTVEPVTVEGERELVTATVEAGDYYKGGRRVMQGGVPCKVWSRRSSAETLALKAHLAHVLAGECDWSPGSATPGFSFSPVEAGEVKRARKVTTCAVPNAVKAYYKGGHRVIIDGVPVRIASKPTRNRLAMLRECRAFAPIGNKLGWSDAPRFSAERCEDRYEAALAEMRAAMEPVRLAA